MQNETVPRAQRCARPNSTNFPIRCAAVKARLAGMDRQRLAKWIKGLRRNWRAVQNKRSQA